MPSAEWVNLSAASENVVAVDCAALLRPVSPSLRWRMVESVAAVASAPPATELAARSSWRLEFEEFEDFPGGIAVRAAGLCGRGGGGHGLRRDGRRSRFRRTLSKQTERHELLSGSMR
jgi:hypothetical protein